MASARTAGSLRDPMITLTASEIAAAFYNSHAHNVNANNVPAPDDAATRRGENLRGRRSFLLLPSRRRRSRTQRQPQQNEPQQVTTTTVRASPETLMTVRERRRRERKVKQERDERIAEIEKHLIVKVRLDAEDDNWCFF